MPIIQKLYFFLFQRSSTVVNPTNCDISMDTSQSGDRSYMGSAPQFRPKENSASMAGLSAQRNPPRGRSPMMQQQQQPQQQQQQQQQFRQQPNRPANMDDLMMMMSQQQSYNQQQQQQQQGAEGGYNMQRVMDVDHFEHYKRPPSRERSVDVSNLPSSLAEAKPVRSSRPPSR